MDSKSRIIELKRKNQINNLCKLWLNKGIPITIDTFLNVEETLVLQTKIMNKLEEIDKSNSSKIYESCGVDIRSEFTKILKENIDKEKEYVFFVRNATSLGGIILKGDIIIEKPDFLVEESELFSQGCSIFFSVRDAECGICLWKGEYDNRVYIWKENDNNI